VVGQWLGSFERAAVMQMIAALAAFVLLTRVSEDFEPHPAPARRRWLPPGILAPGLAVGFVNVQYPVVTGFLILHLARHGNSGPAAFSAYALLVLLSRFFLGRLPDRMRPSVTYYGGLTAMGLGLLVIASGPAPVVAVGAAAVLGFGLSLPWSSIATTVLRRTPERERGSTVGVLSAFYDLFVGISSFAAGEVSGRFGYSAAFYMAAASLIGAAIAGRFVFPAVEAQAPVFEERCAGIER